MINYYQPFLFPFLHSKKYRLPRHLTRYYYYSWEDGLWDLLAKKKIPKNSTILIPDFYCLDVIENIKNHGYSPILYPLDQHFQIDEHLFQTIIKERQPSVIFVFHACGITSNVFEQRQWLTTLPHNTIIIEDCVHRLVDPNDIHLLHPNHIVMDSLRKDSPLPGSFMYGSHKFLSFNQGGKILTGYSLSSSLLYTSFRFILTLSALLNIPRLTSYAHTTILKAHDDIIGDSASPHKGLFWIPWIHRFIDFNKVKRLKIKQVALYTKNLSFNSLFFRIHIPEKDTQHLHVFPLGIKLPAQQCKRLEQYLHSKGIIVWCKFPDAPWSKDKAVLFLPLGFHIKDSDIYHITHSLSLYQHSL